MTIVAVKDGIMAADTLVVDSDMACGWVRKWVALPNGGFLGAAGELGVAQKAMADALEKPLEDIRAEKLIYLNGNDVMERYGMDGEWCRVNAPFFAIGSGEEMARGAMAAGASALEAVEICIKYRVDCGGTAEVAE